MIREQARVRNIDSIKLPPDSIIVQTPHPADFCNNIGHLQTSYAMRMSRQTPDEALVLIIVDERDAHTAMAEAVYTMQAVFNLIQIGVLQITLRDELRLRFITNKPAPLRREHNKNIRVNGGQVRKANPMKNISIF